MRTITTKQLRDNMLQIIDELRVGNSINLSYRHQVIGLLQPVNRPGRALRRGSPEAIRISLQNLQSMLVPNSVQNDFRSIKEQTSVLRSRKYE